MKTPSLKTVRSFVAKALGATLILSSFVLLVWIAYCLTCLTKDWFSLEAQDDRNDVDIVLIHC
jgi:hypothetical protein